MSDVNEPWKDEQGRLEPWRRIVGRGAQRATHNRFESVHIEADLEHLEAELTGKLNDDFSEEPKNKVANDDANAKPDELKLEDRKIPTQFFIDESQSILVENKSPDIPFRYSINPYRGCEHGCAYCYARPYHEYLGMSSGIDFETKIMVKKNAPELLRKELNRRGWTGEEVIAISGVTDCYQPAEREWRITRGLVEVLSESRQAFGMISKNALMTRDIDLLGPLAAQRLFQANISITTLDADLCRVLEPRTSPPAKKIEAIRKLTAAGIPVRVMVAPIMPGLNDVEIPAILKAAAAAGAKGAGYTLLRLPYGVKEVFLEWLDRFRPELRERVEGHIRDTRGGEITNANFGERMRGTGEYAAQIAQTVEVFCRKLGLNNGLPPFDTTLFRPPTLPNGQMNLF